jgi:hypothetical protein
VSEFVGIVIALDCKFRVIDGDRVNSHRMVNDKEFDVNFMILAFMFSTSFFSKWVRNS